MIQFNSTDFNKLKTDFIEYIKEKEEKKGKNVEELNIEENFFLYANEFERFAKKELDIKYSNFDKNLDELTSKENLEALLELINEEEEKIINSETEEYQNIEASEDLETEENNETNLINATIVEMFENEEFKNTVDTDADGKINEEELLLLINTAKGNDYNEENLSFSDLIDVMSQAAEDEFELTTTDTIEESLAQESPQTAGSKGYNGSNSYYNNGGNYSAGSSSGNKNYTKGNNSSSPVSVDNMNSAQLKEEVATRETNLQTAQADLTATQEGTTDELNELKTTAEASFEAYTQQLEALDPQKAEQLKLLTQNKETIEANNIAIQNHKTTITTLDTQLSSISSQKTTLEGKLSELKSAKNEEENESVINSIDSQISSIESEIANLTKEETEINNEKTTLEEEIAKLEEENTTLQGEGETIEEQIAALEEEISKIENEDLQAAKEKYEQDKLAFETKKEGLITEATNKVAEAQTALKEAQDTLTKQLEYEAQWKYSPSGMTDLTRTAVELAYKQLGIHEDAGDNKGEMLKYGGNAGDPWCASFVSWLYGKGQTEEGGQTNNNSPISYTAGVSGLMQQGKNAGFYSNASSYLPVPGDIMIQKSNGASHTGIVVGCDGEYVYTIEGNSSDAVRERKYKIGGSEYGKISGYVRMNEWSGGSGNISGTTYLENSNSEDADKNKRRTR